MGLLDSLLQEKEWEPRRIPRPEPKLRGSLARRALLELTEKGLIRQVVAHRSQFIYTRVTKDNEEEEAAAAEGGVVVEKKPKKVNKSKAEKKAEAEAEA